MSKTTTATTARSKRTARRTVSESISERLKKSIASCRKLLSKVSAAYVRKPSGDELHAVRVALRRTAAVAVLFHGYPNEDDGKGIKRECGKLRRELSARRQREISASLLRRIESVSADADVKVAGALNVLGLEGERGRAPDLRRGIELLSASLQSWSASCSKEPIDDDDLRKRVGKRLRRARRRVREAGVPNKRSLHRLRVAGKALRYGLELVDGIEGNAASIIASSKDFQDALGEANDWAELCVELESARKASSGEQKTDLELVSSRIEKEREHSLSSARIKTKSFLRFLKRSPLNLGQEKRAVG